MASSEYWKKREEAWLDLKAAEEADIQRSIERKYMFLVANIEDRINAFYQAYAGASGISMAEAQKAVSAFDVDAFKDKAAKYVKEKDFSPKANKELKLYNATMRINRLEMLKSEIGLEMLDTFSQVEKAFDETLFSRAADEISRQAGILGETISDNHKMARDIVDASFHNATWSQRLWMRQGTLKNEVDNLLTNGLIQGINPKVLARSIRDYAKKDTIANTERLMRTELARVQTDAQLRMFREYGFEQFMFIALKESPRTCEICAGMDGHVFNTADMSVGENAPPMHPNCRCSTAAVVDRENNLSYKGRKQNDTYLIGAYYDRNVFRFAKFKTAGVDPIEYAITKEAERFATANNKRDVLGSMLKSGEISDRIRWEKQKSHIAGTKERRKRVNNEAVKSSELYTEVDVKSIISGTGRDEEIEIYVNKAVRYYSVDFPIGTVYNVGKGKYVETKRVKIEYSRNGAHVYPVKDW